MSYCQETYKAVEDLINKVATEVALSRPGLDEGMLPVFSLLGDLQEEVSEIVVLAEATGSARKAVEALLDAVSPFDDQTLSYLSEFSQWFQIHMSGAFQGEKVKGFVSWEAFCGSCEASSESADEEVVKDDSDRWEQLAKETDVLLQIGDMDDQELLTEFYTEAQEHLENIESSLLEVEADPSNKDEMNSVFRAFHTIKGVSGFLNLVPINRLAHEVETLLDHARNGKVAIEADVVTVVLKGRDRVQLLVNQVSETLESGKKPEEVIPVSDLIRETIEVTDIALAKMNGEEVPERKSVDSSPAADVGEEADTGGEDASAESGERGFFAKTSEPETAKASAPSAPESDNSSAGSKSNGGGSIRVNTLKLDNLMDMVGELVIVQSQLQESSRSEVLDNSPMQRNLGQLSRITKDLQHTSMSLRMIPIKQTFQKMGRIVRDVTAKNGKKVLYQISGEDTELDRNVVEKIGDPLIHMIRNAVDHGVETVEQRIAAGKPEQGVVMLKAYHQGSNIVIELSDDGRGMDHEKLLAKAQQKGLVSPEQNFTKEEIFQFIFLPGFSTAEKITDISGRGVGMDVVRKNIENLRGTVEISSTLGKGSIFRIKLPLTMAIIDGLVVKVGPDKFILPTTSVKVAVRPEGDQINTFRGQAEALELRGKTIPFVRLSDVFGIESDSQDATDGIIVIIESGARPFGILVDDMVSKQEVVIKSLGTLMQGIRGIAGGAILGDGTIALILDPVSLAPERAAV